MFPNQLLQFTSYELVIIAEVHDIRFTSAFNQIVMFLMRWVMWSVTLSIITGHESILGENRIKDPLETKKTPPKNKDIHETTFLQLSLQLFLTRVVEQYIFPALGFISMCCFDLTHKCRTSKPESIWFDPSILFSVESYGGLGLVQWHHLRAWQLTPKLSLTQCTLGFVDWAANH